MLHALFSFFFLSPPLVVPFLHFFYLFPSFDMVISPLPKSLLNIFKYLSFSYPLVVSPISSYPTSCSPFMDHLHLILIFPLWPRFPTPRSFPALLDLGRKIQLSWLFPSPIVSSQKKHKRQVIT